MPSYGLNAPKRAANLRVNEDLLNRAKSLDINLSATLEKALAQALREKQLSNGWQTTVRPSLLTMSM
nr:type II toxin-antitoxin system CcdA family antitoxin [Pseudomonas argentinensis]